MNVQENLVNGVTLSAYQRNALRMLAKNLDHNIDDEGFPMGILVDSYLYSIIKDYYLDKSTLNYCEIMQNLMIMIGVPSMGYGQCLLTAQRVSELFKSNFLDEESKFYNYREGHAVYSSIYYWFKKLNGFDIAEGVEDLIAKQTEL